MSQPFSGVRVLDLTHVLAGPFCSWQFALLGADVIKVEDPAQPDCARGRGPDKDDNASGLGLNYQVQGTNKRAVAINLKSQAGREIFSALVATADVLVENYRTGALAALGLGYDDLKVANPGLVYCSITGFGDVGIRAEVNAYDNTIQAASGVIAQSGGHKPGLSFIDYSAGYSAAFAVSAALFRREREGHGTHVTCSMYETALMLMAPEVAAEKRPRQFTRTKEPGISAYATADGTLMLGAFTPSQNQRLWNLLAQLGYDAQDFAQTADWPALWRKASRAKEALTAIFERETASHWEGLLRDAGLPAERVRTLREAVADPQLEARGFFVPEPSRHPGQHRYPLPVGAFRFSEDGPSIVTAAPRVGEHTDAVLGELGMDARTIADLRRREIVQ